MNLTQTIGEWGRRKFPGRGLILAALLLGSPCAAGPERSGESRLRLTLADAVLLGLESHHALRVERLNPEIRRTREAEERSRYDSLWRASLSAGEEPSLRSARTGTGLGAEDLSERLEVGLAWEKRWLAGTTINLETLHRREDAGPDTPEFHTLNTGIALTQPLLRGGGSSVNRALIRQAEIDTRISEYELVAFTEALVAAIEAAYWDYVLARRRLVIVGESAVLAEKQLQEVERRIEVGALAATERAAARAEKALRREALINAESLVATRRLQLLRLVAPEGGWALEVLPADAPAFRPPEGEPPEERARQARERRPDMRQARLALERGELELVRTRNGLLPRMDFFIRLGRTAYAESFGEAMDELEERDTEWAAGLRFEMPFGRRAERARQERGILGMQQAEAALRNLGGLIEMEVLTAHIEWVRSAEQIRATAVTRALQEEKLRAEEEKFRVGKSTALLVAQAQRDVLAGRISEVEALLQYIQAQTRLDQLEGRLLDRRRLQVLPHPVPPRG